MKFRLILFFIILSYSCNLKKETTINVISEIENLDFFEIIRPVNGIILFHQNRDTIYKNEKGELKFSTEINETELIRVIVKDKWFRLILQPNKNFTISVTKDLINFTGENSKVINYYNKNIREIPNTTSIFGNSINDTIGVELSKKIDSLKKLELKSFKEFRKEIKIDKEQERIIKNDIDYFYSSLLLEAIYVKQLIRKPINYKSAEKIIQDLERKYPLEITKKPID